MMPHTEFLIELYLIRIINILNCLHPKYLDCAFDGFIIKRDKTGKWNYKVIHK